MTSPRISLKFPKAVRVRSRLDFAAVYERGLRISDVCLSLIVLPNQRLRSRLGLAVSKRCGNAVQRNRLKRRLREVFRLTQSILPPGLDLVIQPRADTPLNVEVLKQSLSSLTRRAAKKLAAQIEQLPTASSASSGSASGGAT